MHTYFENKKFLVFESETSIKANLYKYYLNIDNIESFSKQNHILKELSMNKYDFLIIELGRLNDEIIDFINKLKIMYTDLFIVVLSITNKINIDKQKTSNIDLYLERPMIPKNVINRLKDYLNFNN